MAFLMNDEWYSVWRNDVVKGAAERKQAAWREVWELGMRLQNTDV